MKKMFESKEYLKYKLNESESRCQGLIDKLAIAMATIDELQEDTYRLEETTKSYREQLENNKIVPNTVTPDFGEKHLSYIHYKNNRLDSSKIELFKKRIIEFEY